MYGHEKTGTLKQSTIKPILRESRDKEFNSDLNQGKFKKNEYDDYSTNIRSKYSTSTKKMRNDSFATAPHLSDNSFSYVKKPKRKIPPNDFDPLTVKGGLEAIDLEIHDIDEHIPEEAFENDDEIEELIRANKILRDKVSQIADLVVSAITKASTLK